MHPPRYENGDRVGLGKSGQVMKVTVLPVCVFDIPIAMKHRGRRKNGDGVLAYHAHKLPAAAHELVVIHGFGA